MTFPVIPIGFGSGGTTGYSANAVNFDGTNDFLTRGGDLTGASDGQEGLVSFWVNLTTGSDSAQLDIINNEDAGAAFGIRIRRLSNNSWQVRCRNSAGTDILAVTSQSAWTVSDGWHHVLASWNLATPEAYLYISDADDEPAGATETDDTIDYTKGFFAIGADQAGNDKMDADIADLIFDDAFLDITVESNRRKFINSAGKPVDQGSDGSDQLGYQPLVFLSGATASWHTNLGSGGGFTENGALTDASTSPSD